MVNVEEIAGRWQDVKAYLSSLSTKEDVNRTAQVVLDEVEKRNHYDATTIITIDEAFDALEYILDKFKEEKDNLAIKPVMDYITTASSKLYQGFRNKIQSGDFDTTTEWPEAQVNGKDLTSKIQFYPEISSLEDNGVISGMQDVMRQKVIDLQKQGDLTADVFDVITAKWLREAKNPESMMNITVNEILEARGIQRMQRRGETRSGYDHDQRKMIARQVETLCFAWIEVAEMEVTEMVKGKRKRTKWRGESKALVTTSRIGQVRLDNSLEPFAWTIRPGDVFSKFLFGPGRETAKLSCKALQYDYYRQRWEKRLARYVSWQWKISEKRQSWRVKTLLDGIEEETNKRHPARTKDRLEKALSTLQDDGIISGWRYNKIPKDLTSRRGWWRQWEDCLITMTAPVELLEQYKGLIEKRNKYRGGGSSESGNSKEQS